MNDRFSDARAERGHALCKPLRNAAAMKRKIGSSGTFHLAVFLTHTPDIKTGAEDHREQKEYRNQHYETIPQLLDHVLTSLGSTVRVWGGDTNLARLHAGKGKFFNLQATSEKQNASMQQSISITRAVSPAWSEHGMRLRIIRPH